MSEREQEITEFLTQAGWGAATRTKLADDAGYRSYQRLSGANGKAMLMNAPPGGDQLRSPAAAAYNRLAHLATDCRPFVAVAHYLSQLGLSAPQILAADLPRGLLLLEDLGDDLFAKAIPEGADETLLYGTAIDVLLALHAAPVPERLPVGDGGDHVLSQYDARAQEAEVLLLSEWYAPQLTGRALPEAALAEYIAHWRHYFALSQPARPVLVLRDYHAQNLFWLPGRSGVARVGLIDFQDGLLGSPAYDLVSLLEDARRDVPPALQSQMLERYCAGAKAMHRSFDEAAFRMAYAVAGAQRNCKILGIFARLAKRDNKPAYLQLIPRVRGWLRNDLAHPAFAPLKAWFAAHLPLED
ncbi:MAG TPA: phosphotransferase [Alphaproteobacteria bacterium]|nr:phosphotransferase [Alphaproteobacteria bacterium]